MNAKVEAIKIFIEKYGEDYLETGAKKELIERLEGKNAEKYALELLDIWDTDWVNRVEEVKRIKIYTDTRLGLPIPEDREHYEAVYTDEGGSENTTISRIPTLKLIRERKMEKYRNNSEGR